MPLEQSTSKEAFGHNIGSEEKAGKPRKQAIAIAFSEKRKAQKENDKADNKKWNMYDTHKYN